MLDDIAQIENIDKSGMLNILLSFPDQIEEAVAIVDQTELPKLFKINNILICGMGGSAISGDILQSYLRDRFHLPIMVNRCYDLPKWADKHTLIFSQSYSGNTEETLTSFKQAYERNCQIIGISSGGKLEEYCRRRNVFHIKLPQGYPPRTATPYLLFSSLFALKKTGLLQYTIEQETQETIHLMKETRECFRKTIPTERNPVKRLAKTIYGTFPQVYGWGLFEPIAKRWVTQFNENSKLIARYEVIPECNHNDIVGWTANHEISKKCSCIIFRDRKHESLPIKTRLDFMKKLLGDAAATVEEIQTKGKTPLARIMYLLYVGDYLSCYLALLRNIDPTPVEIIEELKQELARI